jgi:putative transcriptional regulator
MSNHHPPAELLLDYASGALATGPSIAVAGHVALCAECGQDVRAFDAIGGEMLVEAEAVAMSADALTATMALLDDDGARAQAPAHAALDAQTRELIPPPLRPYLGGSLNELSWKKVGRMIEEARLALPLPGVKATLMRIKAGSVMPRHSHRGLEYTLVLAGGFRDNEIFCGPGDFAVREGSDEHQPIVDEDEDCLCLAVLDAPLKLSGAFGWLVNPFLRT